MNTEKILRFCSTYTFHNWTINVSILVSPIGLKLSTKRSYLWDIGASIENCILSPHLTRHPFNPSSRLCLYSPPPSFLSIYLYLSFSLSFYLTQLGVQPLLSSFDTHTRIHRCYQIESNYHYAFIISQITYIYVYLHSIVIDFPQ